MFPAFQRSSFPPILKNRCFHSLSDLLQGQIPQSHLLQIHARAFVLNLHQDNLIANRLINRYPTHLSLKIFHNLKSPNVLSFNSIIRLLSEEVDGLFSRPMALFKLMKAQSVSPNGFTFSFLLKATLRSRCELYVKMIHTHILKTGFVSDVVVCSGLLVAYVKGVGHLASGRMVFDEMPERGSMVCSWTSLMEGLVKAGEGKGVLELFLAMVKENLKPEDDTMVSVLSACSSFGIVEIEKCVGALQEFLCGEGFGRSGCDSVRTVLVYLCGKWGKVEQSREWFDQIGEDGKRRVHCWNAMIGTYVQNGCPMLAVSLFRLMVNERNVRPNHVTMVNVLSACSQIGDIEFGKWVHDYIKLEGKRGILEQNANLATALIDMYSKCGSLEKAREAFDHLLTKDVVSFNAMIMGLAINGEGRAALKLFHEMHQSLVIPNAGTFLSVLCACSHSGLLDEGRRVFFDMSSHFSTPPKLEHYACYIDLLARVGLIEEALQVANSMLFKPNSFVWGALLNGCLLHSKFELAEEVSEKLADADPENTGGYVMMSNAFAVDSRWGDVCGLRSSMRQKGVRKQPGHSWISINGVIQEFLAGSVAHLEVERIHHVMDVLVKEMKTPSS